MVGSKNFHHNFFSGHIHNNDMEQRNYPPTYLVEILCENPGLSCDTVIHAMDKVNDSPYRHLMGL